MIAEEISRRLDAMAAIVDRHCISRRQATPIPGLTLYRAGKAVDPRHVMYEPRVCVVLRGSKTVSIGATNYEADQENMLVSTADLPVVATVRPPAGGRPHVGLILDLDREMLAEAIELRTQAFSARPAHPGLAVAPVTFDLLDAFGRLLVLLDRPAGADYLARLARQEIHFRLLQGPLREMLVSFTTAASQVARIGRATRWLKANYAGPASIASLARIAGMSVTSFHRHFRSVTLMTPLQYRNQVRLQEAQRLLLSGRHRAGEVGLAVGFGSPSQFSREYKRMFGHPPASEATKPTPAEMWK